MPVAWEKKTLSYGMFRLTGSWTIFQSLLLLPVFLGDFIGLVVTGNCGKGGGAVEAVEAVDKRGGEEEED